MVRPEHDAGAAKNAAQGMAASVPAHRLLHSAKPHSRILPQKMKGDGSEHSLASAPRIGEC